jgi:CcmD family protein
MVYLAAAFVAVWLIVTVYLLFMSNRQRHLEDELRTLEELMKERDQLQEQLDSRQ